jgi:dTDP-4-amino-4,6-dideoxygalactose transaminase
VGVQTYTCHTVFESIYFSGCDIVFLETANDFTIDIFDLRKKIETIDILIVTHTFGIPADIDEIKKICKNKIIIEDCSHALFSKYKESPVGTFFNAAVFSYGYGKFPSIGPGGFAIVNDRNILDVFVKKYNSLNSHSFIEEILYPIKNYLIAKAFIPFFYSVFTRHLLHKTSPYKVLKSPEKKGIKSSSNLFIKNFQYYLECVKKQRINGDFLNETISNYTPFHKDHSIYQLNYYIFPLLSSNRDCIIKFLLNEGIESGKFFSRSIEWAKNFGYNSGMTPNAEEIANEIFTLPCYSILNKKIMTKIKDKLYICFDNCK